MDNAPIEKENNERIDFNEKLKSFEDIFFDTDIIPNSRYRLVENTEEAKPGYCNGILNEYEIEILRKALSIVDPESNSEALDLSINTETVYKKNVENFDIKVAPSKRLAFNIGNKILNGMSAEDSLMEQEIKVFLLTIMGVVERRVKNTTTIEFRIA